MQACLLLTNICFVSPENFFLSRTKFLLFVGSQKFFSSASRTDRDCMDTFFSNVLELHTSEQHPSEMALFFPELRKAMFCLPRPGWNPHCGYMFCTDTFICLIFHPKGERAWKGILIFWAAAVHREGYALQISANHCKSLQFSAYKCKSLQLKCKSLQISANQVQITANQCKTPKLNYVSIFTRKQERLVT